MQIGDYSFELHFSRQCDGLHDVDRCWNFLFFNWLRTIFMKITLLRSAVLLSLLCVAGQTRADDNQNQNHGCVDPGQPSNPPSCPIGQYPIIGHDSSCPQGVFVDCNPVGSPPDLPSLTCSSANFGVSCEASPQPFESGLITYSWSLKGPVQTQQPKVGVSPTLYAVCSPGLPITVTVILTGPGYASSMATSTFECGITGVVDDTFGEL